MDNLRCVRETPPRQVSAAGRASHEENASRLTGTVERITYQNAENGFSVIKCRAKGYSDLVTVAGIGQKRVNQVKKSWQEQKEIKNIMLFLQSNDVSTSHAGQVMEAKTIHRLLEYKPPEGYQKRCRLP